MIFFKKRRKYVFNGQHRGRIKYMVLLAEAALGLLGFENNGLHVW